MCEVRGHLTIPQRLHFLVSQHLGLRIVVVVVVVVLGFTTLLTSQVISVAFYSEREKSDKFSSEALISA